MRNVRWSMAASGLAVFGAVGWVMGCSASPQEDLTDPSFARSTTAASGSSSTGGNPSCTGADEDILSPATIAKFVNDDCGVFVRADAANVSGEGTKEKPFKTLQAAIDGANGRAIFMCAHDAFAEKIAVSEPLYLYGGFDCTKDWSWDTAARSTITGKADEVTFTITKAAKDVTIWNLAVKAPGATKDSGSSIAMAIDDVPASLVRCDITAATGKDGIAGKTYTDSAMAGANASTSVAAACVVPFAALPGKTTCGGVVTDGGPGGLGGITGTDSGHGQNGGDGVPVAVQGKGGLGEGQPNATSMCTPGIGGGDGDKGKVGNAGASKGNTLSLTGVLGGSGGDGMIGIPGQGGGGGGGSRSGLFCGAGMNSDGSGPGGGGGGAGGCGGLGGGGGQLGGSSIAILSLGIQLKLADVTLTAGEGGKGGGGGLAQVGGDFGKGAIGGKKAAAGFNSGCDGSNGGRGGDGGAGGGGRGGHSIGIAFAGTPPAKLALQFTGGLSGPGADGADQGIGTAAAACWDFASHTTCAN
jgi:hypothetical protein